MKYTLTYKNKQGVEARLDIITHGVSSTTEIIEGTDTPFILNYKREKNDKEGYIISSSADIAIYESGTFNIDTLKTSNETDIKVEYYIDNVLTWSGFVVPDFFSRVIGTPAIVNMVASDRLGSLKGQTLSGLPAMVTLSSLVSSCLSKTGLSLPINLKADFTSVVGNENVFASKVISQRFTDTKGRNISCYDILRSILVMTNSVVVQRNGQWYIANKIQIEQGTALPTTQYIDFDEVSVGARRQIMPVASSVGVYHEFGGERKHPQNFDFSEALSGWTAVNGFIAQVNNKEIIGFNYSDTEITPIFGSNDTLPYLLSVNTNPANKLVYTNPETGWNFEAAPYLKATFPVVSLNDNIVNINFDVGVIGIFSSYYPFVIIARNRNDANDIYALNSSGLFIPYDFHSDDFLLSSYLGGENYTTPIPGARKISGKLEVDNVTNYDIEIRIYQASIIKPRGYFGDVTLAINFSSVTFNNETEIPKGNIYKTTQGDNFTKVHETDTTVIGDYRTSGLNGYGYPYPIDDTSSLLTSTGLLTERWTAPDNANELPILQHVTRQRAKMFSIAHDLLMAEIDSDVLDPLATFRDCSGKKYVMVSGSQDFLRGTINVEIEEIAYSTTIWKQDYIYSYFGEGEEGISSVGGISESAPSAGGGGMTPEQLEILNNLSSWWKYDEVNDAIYSDLSVYSLKEVSAYGVGSGTGGGSGPSYERLDSWADYDSTKSGWVLSALLGNDLHSRVANLESGSALNISVTGSGNALTGVSKSGNTLSFVKGETFSLSNHTHNNYLLTSLKGAANGLAELDANGLVPSSQLPSYVDDVLEFADFTSFPATGTTGKIYVALNTNLTYRWSGSAYIEISPSLALGETSSTAYRGDRGKIAYDHSQVAGGMHVTSTERTNWNTAYTNNHTHSNKTIIDQLSQSNLDVLALLSIDNGKLKIDADTYSTGEISAYGAGIGGGGTSYNRLDSWADYTADKSGWVLSALLGNDLNSRVTSLEGGSATSISVTGAGNAITNVTKSGNSLIFAKDLTFSLSTHNHSGTYQPLDADLTSIAGLADASTGFLKKTGASTWALDTTVWTSVNDGSGSGLDADLLDGLNSTDFLRSNNGNAALLGFSTGSIVNPAPSFVFRYLGTISDTKSGLILFAQQYSSSYLNKQGFIGNVHITRGHTGAFNKTNNVNVSIATAYNGTLFNISGDYSGCKIVTTTYNSIVYYGLYIPSNSARTVYLYGWLYSEPIFIADATSYTITDVMSSAQKQYINNVEAATINSNVASATKLQTARTIWGQSFDGTANVSGALTSVTDITASGTIQSLYGNFTNLSTNYLPKQSSSGLVNSIIYDNGTNVGIDGKLSAINSISSESVEGVATFYNSYNNYDVNPTISYPVLSLIRMGKSGSTYSSVFQIGISRWSTSGSFANTQADFKLSNRNVSVPDITVMSLRSNGNVGIGTTSPSYKLDVAGTGRFTSSLITPKVDFGNGFTIEPSGTELVFKYNGVIKQRMLSDGSIVATGEITAYS